MAVRGVDALQNELNKTKNSLKNVDENIAKLTGRDPTEGRPAPRRVRDDTRGGGRLFITARRGLEDGPSPVKRRAMGAGPFNRLGPPRVIASRLGPRQREDSPEDDDMSFKPAVQSSVVATPKDGRSREEVAEEQNKDQGSRQRNRRMFGLLLGTLQRFKNDEKDKTDKERRRQEIEQKLEEKAKAEQDNVKKERQNLFKERQKKQEKIRQLEQKMELVKIHEEWESQTKKLGNFIRTKAKPHIYFQPRSHTSGTLKRQDDTKKILQDIIRDRKKQLEEEIHELTRSEVPEVGIDHSHRRHLSQQTHDSDEDMADRDSHHRQGRRERKGSKREVNGRDRNEQEERPQDLEDEEGPELMESQITRTVIVDQGGSADHGQVEEDMQEQESEAPMEETAQEPEPSEEKQDHREEPNEAEQGEAMPEDKAEKRDTEKAEPPPNEPQTVEEPHAEEASREDKENTDVHQEAVEEPMDTPSKSSGRKRRWDMTAVPDETELKEVEGPIEATHMEGEVKLEEIVMPPSVEPKAAEKPSHKDGKHSKRSHSTREESDDENRREKERARRHDQKEKKDKKSKKHRHYRRSSSEESDHEKSKKSKRSSKHGHRSDSDDGGRSKSRRSKSERKRRISTKEESD